MVSEYTKTPDWDLEQLEVIMDNPSSWQLVVAGPGAGKTAVACQRVAFLVDEGVPSSRILLVSFTRSAVAELRDRVVAYANAEDSALSVRISTIDSHAWSLRIGFDDESIQKVFGEGPYELNISRVVELFKNHQLELTDFMSRLEHLIIDEAQDVMGLRAELVIYMLRSLSEECGVTIFADSAQAIYGFTTDEEETSGEENSLIARISSESPRPFKTRHLTQIYRIQDPQLVEVFQRTRKEVESPSNHVGHILRVFETIRETCGNDMGITSFPSIIEFLSNLQRESLLMLFRRRADALHASSYCSKMGILHRLRMSGLPTVVRPWIGWLFAEEYNSIVSRDQFLHLWEQRKNIAPSIFEGENLEAAWTLLHRMAAGYRQNTLDIAQLRRLIARQRPPIEFCYPDLGSSGPILGTIHASKGREADIVILCYPTSIKSVAEKDDPAIIFEEGRVYYVGATRARQKLFAIGHRTMHASYLDSRRVVRRLPGNKVQFEVGRDGDLDKLAHLSWSNAIEVQNILASCVGRSMSIQARTMPQENYAIRLILEYQSSGVTQYIEVGEMSQSFHQDFSSIWSLVDSEKRLKPPIAIPHLYLFDVTTLGLSDEQLDAVGPPFNRSGFALAPVIKGYPTIQFLYHRSRRSIL